MLRNPGAGFLDIMRASFDAFPHVFVAVLLAGLATLFGLVLLIIPGLYVAVRLYFVAQSVVVGNKRGAAALRDSWELTDRAWWRTLGIAICVTALALIPTSIFSIPFGLLSKSADSDAFSLLGTTMGQIAASPFVAIGLTLLYFDLDARRAGMPPPGPQYAKPPGEGGWQPPPPPGDGQGPPDPPGL
jgi:hypothetical protein